MAVKNITDLHVLGNVGIGTTSPATALDVNGSIRVTGRTTPTSGKGLELFYYSPSDLFYLEAYDYTNSAYKSIRYAGLSHQFITGNVGIGTTSPSRKLHIVDSVWDNNNGGGVIFENSNTVGASLTLKPSASAVANGANGWAVYAGGPSAAIGDGNLGFWAHGTNDARMMITRGGNVGIGTTSPGAKLDVTGNIRGNNLYVNDSSVPSLYMERGDGLPQPVIRLVKSNDNLLIGNTAIDEVIFYDDAGEAMRLDGSGNLGIGTTSPDRNLHIYQGNSGRTGYPLTGGIDIESTSITGINILSPDNGYGRIYFGSPSSSTAGALEYIHSSTLSSGYMKFRAGGADHMFILGNGNVGIGTTGPVTGLDVRTSAYSNTTARFGETRPVYIINADPIIGFNQYYDGGWKAGTTGYSGNVGLNNNGEIYFNVSTASVAADGAVSNRQAMKIFNDANITWGTGGTGSFGEGLLTMNSSWGTGKYPTLGSYNGSAGSLIMLHNPHVPFRTDNPATAYTGRAGLRMAIDTGATSFWDMGLAGDFFHIYKNGTGEFLRIDNTGNVGIGTTSPAYALDIERVTGEVAIQLQARDNTSNTAIYFGDNSDADVGSLIYNQGSNYMSFTTNAGERMRITNTGNVGIGTTSPNEKFVVSDGANINFKVGQLAHQTIANPGVGFTFSRTTSDAPLMAMGVLEDDDLAIMSRNTIQFLTGGTNNYQYTTERMRIHADGNVSVGTTNAYARFSVKATSHNNGISVNRQADNTAALYIGNDGGNNPILASNNADMLFGRDVSGTFTERMRLTNGGNVGIGTTSPSEKLEVSGNILASGDITAFSDANLKENVETVPNALEKVRTMRGVTFNKIGEEKRSVGVIAQELLEVLPEAVHKSGEHYSVAYGNIVGVLIEAMKEQQAQIDELKAQLDGITK